MLKIDYFRVGSCCHPEWVTLRGGSLKPVSFPALAVLIQHPQHGCFLFDTGYSQRFYEATQPFPQRFYRWITPVQYAAQDDIVLQLAKKGIAPSEIKGIFISHFHADHVAALMDFPNAQYLALKDSYDAVQPHKGFSALRRGFLPQLLPADFGQRYKTIESMAPQTILPKKMRPFQHGWDVFGDGSVYAIALPGHARGQMGLWLNGDEDVFLAADACWSTRAFQEEIPPSWLSFLIHDKRSTYLKTLSELHQLSQLNPDVVIMPSHCATVLSRYVDESE